MGRKESSSSCNTDAEYNGCFRQDGCTPDQGLGARLAPDASFRTRPACWPSIAFNAVHDGSAMLRNHRRKYTKRSAKDGSYLGPNRNPEKEKGGGGGKPIADLHLLLFVVSCWIVGKCANVISLQHWLCRID